MADRSGTKGSRKPVLGMSLDIRDFDLERIGFSLSVLESGTERPTSEAYLRMTIPELHVFVKALREADELEVSSGNERKSVRKLPQIREAELRALSLIEGSKGEPEETDGEEPPPAEFPFGSIGRPK